MKFKKYLKYLKVEAILKKAKERVDFTLDNINKLDIETSQNYNFVNWIANNDNHNTVMFRMRTELNDAWKFLEDSQQIDEYIDNIVKFLIATKEIKIVDL